jgi:hypothetical protein
VIDIDPSSVTLAGIGGSGTIDVGANSTLTVSGVVSAGQTFVFTGTDAVLNILESSSFAGTIQDQGPTDQVNLACFAAGTRLATMFGDVAVEDLRTGDRVRAMPGNRLVPIVWIGHRHIDCTRHADPDSVWPVCVRAGAFGDAVPHRDLRLSPDHAVFVDDVLIPIKRLINGTTIERVPMDEVTYYHIELLHHDVLLAEGLPAESYLDVGDRCNFENGGGPIALHPEFSRRGWHTAHIWEALGCAPLIVIGPELDAVRALVNSRATAIAPAASAA